MVMAKFPFVAVKRILRDGTKFIHRKTALLCKWRSRNHTINTSYRQKKKKPACLRARANARKIVGQQDATLLGPTCCERLHTMLCVVATCWKLLDDVWNWSKLRANKCQHFYCFAVIEAWSNNVAFVCTAHPTMLRLCTRTKCRVSTQIHANKR